MNIDFTLAKWLNQPQSFKVSKTSVELTTEPDTDLWQRSYYGFKHDNAPALLLSESLNFSFTTKVSFDYQARFDQAGVIIYLDSDNWFKASIEFETAQVSRLGSVVTNNGYSDWATTDIATVTSIWYRLSRRGPDFLIESSTDGKTFKQMRIFHLHTLGATTPETAGLALPTRAGQAVAFGVYACSPLESSFVARFEAFKLEPCQWAAHETSIK